MPTSTVIFYSICTQVCKCAHTCMLVHVRCKCARIHMCPRTSSFSSSLSILSLFFLPRFYPGTTNSTVTLQTRCLAIVNIGNDDRGTAFSFQTFIFPFYLSIIPQHSMLFLGVFFPPNPVCELIVLFTQLLLHFCSTLTYLVFLSLKNTFFFPGLRTAFPSFC